MIELLVPAYFVVGGLVGVVIPLVLHLIQSSRTVREPFPTIRFLLLAQKKSSHKIKMENILLWLIRTFLLVALALAFAMPMLRHGGAAWVGRSARDVAIVIDGSYSMDYKLGRSTAWEKAIETAIVVLEGLSEQDRLCIFVARDYVDPVIEQLSSDREEAVTRLKGLSFSQTSSELATAIMEANDSLRESKQKREREIHIITDNQALPWVGIGDGEPSTNLATDREGEDDGPKVAAMGNWDVSKLDKRTAVFVSLLGAEAPENVAPIDVKLEPELIMADMPARATIRIGYTGPPRSTVATLYIDDEEIASRSILIGGGEAAGALSFIVPPLTPGRHAARIELPDDNLELDNIFYFLLKAEDQLPTLVIGGRDDTLFLRSALEAELGGRASIKTDWVEPSAIDTGGLNTFSSIFLCNAIPLSAGEIGAIQRFVEAGGLLAIFPGDRASPSDYTSLAFLPAKPAGVRQILSSERKRVLNWDAPYHPILQPLGDASAIPAVDVGQTLVWDTLHARAEKLISHNGEPMLVGRPVGRGYVLLFATSADRSWSDLPLSPYFLPISHQIVHFGAGVGSFIPYVWCAKSLPLEVYLPEAEANSVIRAPNGQKVPVRSALVEGRTLLNVEDLMHAGMYTMNDGAGVAQPALAVNMSRDESDLTPLNLEGLEERIGVSSVYVSSDLEELKRQLEESRVGRTFGEQLLWLVLILAVVEFFYANALMKRGPALSEHLTIDASGKVSA
ncbi:MAG: VWA domain-containing protein [Verrucomicrobiota bacterium]